ncbi:hypothetical protein GDO86_007597 [Hymenochirus boettgeri]|uniref:Uncharacterized protein n=1 Tax=Hymenochirus boettgeri TaxID=247094 RepID=A0A8T2IUD5_9PIPI|nr:hypothetical protein GDO86_007597 [Hymenochirus boettgeri]
MFYPNLPLLVAVILLLHCFTCCQGGCYFQARAPCRFSGRRFALGESWLGNNCQLCTCLHPVGVGCCEM